jgi:hypothetical protein
MKLSNAPQPVSAKLITLEEQTEFFTQKVAKGEHAIAAARQRLDDGMHDQGEYNDLDAALKQLLADKPVLEKKLRAAQSVLSACKSWIATLLPDTILEVVTPKTNGHDLASVRAKLTAAEAELEALRAVPEPSSDIEERVGAYVREMARPTISGVGSGERLRVVWPGGGWDGSGPREHRADPLSLIALLHPDEMVTALLAEIERMADTPLPHAERKKRIAALQAELAELAYVEEMLVAAALANGEDVQRSALAPPAAVLGVRIVEAKRATRAA